MRQFKRTPTLLPITEFAILPITESRRFLLLIPRICLPTEPMLNELGCYLLTVWDPGIPKIVDLGNDEIVFQSAIQGLHH